jgi:hypothetical protein
MGGITMNEHDVVERVALIRQAQDDDEMAHSMEDALYEDILRAIAAGTAENVAEMAKEALKTKDVAFARWCA